MLGEDIRRFGTEKAPADFSLQVMKKLAGETREAAVADRPPVALTPKEQGLISGRARWVFLSICTLLAVYGLVLSFGSEAGGAGYLDQLIAALPEYKLPALNLSIDLSNRAYTLLAMLIAGLWALVLADKVMGRFIGKASH